MGRPITSIYIYRHTRIFLKMIIWRDGGARLYVGCHVIFRCYHVLFWDIVYALTWYELHVYGLDDYGHGFMWIIIWMIMHDTMIIWWVLICVLYLVIHNYMSSYFVDVNAQRYARLIWVCKYSSKLEVLELMVNKSGARIRPFVFA